ncbi:protein of unknown function [Nitrospira japonica]|uniref:Uncharacterized protein n=1 Tax=Nitrospira japonica TaxID=1325564 RepID=A0A1W1I1R9_9BACT|nr:protein of unknown function [Nitrospira japonica]
MQALTELLKPGGKAMQHAESSIDALMLRKWEHEWDASLKVHVERIG